ncbi:hypothetical protein A3Q56_01450 [Intoshia linei]|uniref:Ubiquitin-related modifier 1 homolog n=1 Tax=Intoshia linei TaxID=1819745 RepID=A0A177BAZ4_9BILA|nr:hypothetical protein A3Q56_01450 [Intoshia linei]
MNLKLQFTAGAELFLGGVKDHDVEISSEIRNMRQLIKWIRDDLIQDKFKTLFMLTDDLRPGILVLINDSDWEIFDTYNYELVDKDNILFISTLHGG